MVTSTGLVLALAGCTGSIDGELSADDLGGDLSGPGGPGGPRGGAGGSSCKSGPVKPGVIKRLNRREYTNTMRDLLETPDLALPTLPNDLSGPLGLDTEGAAMDLNNSDAVSYRGAVEEILPRMPAALTNCSADVASNRASCTRQILQRFLRRAFRRTVPEPELAAYAALAGKSDTQAEGIALALKAALLSPHFLFVVVDDSASTPGTQHRLSDFELASRLSYGLWSSMPDETLLSLAEKKQLSSPAVLGQQIERMLLDPKAQRGVLSVGQTSAIRVAS